ncbi:hypothetical protein TUBRATIS_003350 [Tubulinosema ratisbonensis]|uniref:Uncharacterized protein n=1 Tax=Tubulinosema ratisbonensis TaxID=291195 RepID=A0A437APH7_9MICR|nr:hypothetical protein TUBRATIS_003350 [Tubulinosema ratisbonensis]
MKKILPMAGFIGFLVETIFRPSQKYCLTTSENVKDMVRKYELECDKFKLERSAYFLGHCVYSSNDYRVNRITEQADAIFLLNRNPNIFKDVTKSILEQLKKIIDFDHDRKIASFIQKILDCLVLIESCDYDKTELEKLFLYDIKKERLKFCCYCNEYMHEDRFCSSASHTLRLNEKDVLTPVTCSYMFRKAVFCKRLRELFPFTFIDLDNFLTKIECEKVEINTLRQVSNSKEKLEELVENTNVFVGFHEETKEGPVLDSSKKEFKHAECSSLLINPETQAKKTTDIITTLAVEKIKSDNKSEFIKQNLEDNKINVMEKENKIKSKEEHKESTEKEKGQLFKVESKKSDLTTNDVKPLNQTDELKPVEAVLQNKLIEPDASAILPSVADQMEDYLFEEMQEAYGSEEDFYSVTQNKEELELNDDESKNDNDSTLQDMRYYRNKNVEMADIIEPPNKQIGVQSTGKNVSKRILKKDLTKAKKTALSKRLKVN